MGSQADTLPPHFEATVQNHGQCFRVNFALGREDPSGERVSVIIRKNRDDSLKDDRAVIVFVVAKMDRTSRDLTPAIEHRLMHMMAEHPFSAEGGDECGVNIDDPELEVVGDHNFREEATKHNEVDLMFATQTKDFVAVWIGSREGFSIQENGVDPEFFGSLDSPAFSTGDDKRNDSVERSLLNLLLKIDQRGSPARNQNSQSRWG